MSIAKRIVGVISAVCCAVNLVVPGLTSYAVSDSLTDCGLNYTEQTGYDFNNFDCGYSSAEWINAAPGKNWSVNPTTFTLLLIGIGEYSSALNSSGTDFDLDDAFFGSLEASLKNARSNGVTVGIRLRYDANGYENPEPATFEKVLNHIDQLGASGLLDKYEDTITYVESGLVGSWGEQWGGKYTSLECKAQILERFLEITPDTISVSVRTPNTVRTWLSMYCNIETTAADMSCTISDPVFAKRYSRIGLYNDGYMGSDSDLGTYSNRVGETAWLSGAAMYGGEFSGNDEWRLKYTTWQPANALPEMYYTGLSHINCNIYRGKTASGKYSTREEAQKRLDEIGLLYESSGLGNYDFGGEIAENDGSYVASWKWMGYDDFVFDSELDALCGVECDNSAFYGETVWQFIRAHLGYRYVIRSAEMTGSADPGGKLNLRFDMENTGFADAPKDKEAELILTDGVTRFTYDTGINPRNWKSGEKTSENISVTLPETLTGGDWDVYLRISNLNDDSADDSLFCTQLANKDIIYSSELGANYIGKITVSGKKTEQLPEAGNKRASGYYPAETAINVGDSDCVSLLDRAYTFEESDHCGFTFLYKADGIESGSVRLGNWYLSASHENNGYSSAYTTYGLNTMNLTLEENGYYLLNIPFFGCVFNMDISSTAGQTRINALNINDPRNYWSDDTYTIVGENSSFTIMPIGFAEGSPSGYSVTYHLPDGDVVFSGDYGLKDVSSQSITNKKAVTALSLLDREYPGSYVDVSGITRVFKGFTTKENDESCIISESFIAIGDIELYPYYEIDKSASNFNSVTSKLNGITDSQGIRYILDESTMTASAGDGSAWENNSGLGTQSVSSIVIPAFVVSDGKKYAVTSVAENAFASDVNLKNAVLPNTVSIIGENAFYIGTELSIYSDSSALKNGSASDFAITEMTSKTVPGDVNFDSLVNAADLVAMQKYILGRNTVINTPAADLDGSGCVNSIDTALLRRTLFE